VQDAAAEVFQSGDAGGILKAMLIQNLRSRLCLIADADGVRTERLREAVAAALRAGAGMVRYRAKTLSTREMVEQATVLASMTRAASVPLIVNDRVDVALAVGADGVHVGREDMHVAFARRMLGPTAIVGVTTYTSQEARVAETDGATYLAVGPMYASLAGPQGVIVGPEALARVRSATRLPLCASGGVTPETAPELAATGVELIAVASAITAAPDPSAAARSLVEALSRFPDPARVISG
jgi:thiamine-phosphate pyrophosphorylase